MMTDWAYGKEVHSLAEFTTKSLCSCNACLSLIRLPLEGHTHLGLCPSSTGTCWQADHVRPHGLQIFDVSIHLQLCMLSFTLLLMPGQHRTLLCLACSRACSVRREQAR